MVEWVGSWEAQSAAPLIDIDRTEEAGPRTDQPLYFPCMNPMDLSSTTSIGGGVNLLQCVSGAAPVRW